MSRLSYVVNLLIVPLQNSFVQQCATSEPQQKQSRRKRRYGRKRKTATIPTDSNIVNSNETPLVPSSVANPIKPDLVPPRRAHNQHQPLLKDSQPVDNLQNSPSKLSVGVRETAVDRPFSNNISRSFMDKMKRVDEEKSRENVLVERDPRRLSKQKEQDKARNIGNVSPINLAQKVQPKVEVKVNQAPVVAPVGTVRLNEQRDGNSEKSREEIMAERELKKQAKLAKKSKTVATAAPTPTNESASTHAAPVQSVCEKVQPGNQSEKSREEIMAERELKKQEKLAKKNKSAPTNETVATTDSVAKKLENVTISEKPALTKAERREKQEAQRAAKAKLLAEKTTKGQQSSQSTENKSKPEKVEKAKEISVRLLGIHSLSSSSTFFVVSAFHQETGVE